MALSDTDTTGEFILGHVKTTEFPYPPPNLAKV